MTVRRYEDVRAPKDPFLSLLLFAHNSEKRDGRLGMLSRSRAFPVACIRQLGSAWYVGLGQMRDKKPYTQPEVRARVVYSSLYEMRATADALLQYQYLT